MLDRRRRQLEVGELDAALGHGRPAPPPPASAIVSLQCLSIGPHAAPPYRTAVLLGGERHGRRGRHRPPGRPDPGGPIDVYLALATLLGGTDAPGARPAVGPAVEHGFLLTRLDELYDADPFAGVRGPLQQPELVEVFPFEHHLHRFVDAFRRRYLPQRGRL